MSAKRKKKKKVNPCDFTVLILTVILVVIGIVAVFSASYYRALNSESGSPFTFLIRQVLFAVIGAVLMYAASYIEYHFWQRYSLLILAVSIVLLILVLTPAGTDVNGSSRWIYIGPVSIMPGEIAKFAMICFCAAYFSGGSDRVRFPRLIFIVILTAVVAFLIIKQPSLSTAITVCGIVFGIAFIAGLNWGYVIAAVGAGVAGFMILAKTGTYWAGRIASFTDPFRDPRGDGWQVVQSLLALGTGGLTGLGLGKSVQKYLYLPEAHNDFILAIIGEEVGFIGILVIILLFVFLIWRCLHIAMNAPDRFGMFTAGGIAVMIGIQVVLNVAVVTSSMPPTGVSLPFISYGGNSLWILMTSMGIVLNISRKEYKEPEESAAKKKRKLRQETRQTEQRSAESI